MPIKTHFCLSSLFNIPMHIHGLRPYSVYRSIWALSLIPCLCLLACLVYPSPCFADSADDDNTWPDAIEFPQRFAPENENGAVRKAPQPAATPIQNVVLRAKKKRLWPFSKKSKASDAKPVRSEPLTEVGPRELPANPSPLLRLAMPLQLENGILSTGIYLAQPNLKTGDANHEEGPSRILTLIQRNQVMAQFSLKKMASPAEKLQAAGTPSPIQKVNPAIPSPTKVSTRLSLDQRSLIFVLEQADQCFESEPIPLATDQRKVIPF